MVTSLRSVIATADKIRSREHSASNLLEASLQVIDDLNPQLNGFISVDQEGAHQQARALDQEAENGQLRGPLHGIPVAVKANIDVEGLVISGCSDPFQDRIAMTDATCVQRLKNAGAVIVGITNMHELAYGGTGGVSFHGPARNPRNPEHIAGGSSSGSAVSVASGMVPLALGTDTGGSVRIPAAACGIVGFKPSYNKINKTGVLPLSWTLDHVGTLANNVLDAGVSAAVLFDNMAESAALLEKLTTRPSPDTALSCTIGVCHVPDMGVDTSVRQVTTDALSILKDHGASATDFDVQYSQETHVSWLNIMYAEATSYYVKNNLCDYHKFSPSIKVQLEAGKSISAVSYLDAQRFRGFFRDYFAGLFEKYDVICLPTLPVVAPRIGQDTVSVDDKTITTQDAMTFTNQLANMLGCPAISIPVGNSSDGLPIGLSLLMPHGRDFELLELAEKFELILSRQRYRS